MFDPVFILVIAFAFAIAAIIFFLISSDLKDEMTPKFDTQTAIDAITETNNAIKSFDYIFVILLTMLIVSTLISAFFIKSHPIFFFVSTILLFVFMIPAVVLSNAFEKFTEEEKIAPLMTDFNLTDYFMDKLPYILLVTMCLLFIVLFMYKGDAFGGGGGGGFYE